MSKTAISLQEVFCLPVKGHSPDRELKGAAGTDNARTHIPVLLFSAGWFHCQQLAPCFLLWEPFVALGLLCLLNIWPKCQEMKSWEPALPMIDRSWCLCTSASTSSKTGMVCTSAPGTVAASNSWHYFPKLTASPGFISGITSSRISNSVGGISVIGICVQQWGTAGKVGSSWGQWRTHLWIVLSTQFELPLEGDS